MAVLEWDGTGERFYETGVNHAVLYASPMIVRSLKVTSDKIIAVAESSTSGVYYAKISDDSVVDSPINSIVAVEGEYVISRGAIANKTVRKASADKNFYIYDERFTSQEAAGPILDAAGIVIYYFTNEATHGKTTGNYVYGGGVAWNGMRSVQESPDGAEPNELWADNMKYAVLYSAETYGMTIGAYMYPPEFNACDGTASLADGVYIGQQKRQPFGFCYRTEIGNDTATESDDGYKLHLVYNCTAKPSDKDYETINDSPDGIEFSWEVDTTPLGQAVMNDLATFMNETYGLDNLKLKPTACLVLDSRKIDPDRLAEIEKILYGTATTPPFLPLPGLLMRMAVGDFRIFDQPASDEASVGDSVEFSVQAFGTSLSYQWQERTSGGEWASSSATGNATSTMTVTVASGDFAKDFRCKITDGDGKVIYTKVVHIAEESD